MYSSFITAGKAFLPDNRRKKYEFSGNAPTAFQRLRVNAYDLLSDPSVFPASGTGDIFWEGFQVQTPQSGGKMLYFCYERNAAYAAASFCGISDPFISGE